MKVGVVKRGDFVIDFEMVLAKSRKIVSILDHFLASLFNTKVVVNTNQAPMKSKVLCVCDCKVCNQRSQMITGNLTAAIFSSQGS